MKNILCFSLLFFNYSIYLIESSQLELVETVTFGYKGYMFLCNLFFVSKKKEEEII